MVLKEVCSKFLPGLLWNFMQVESLRSVWSEVDAGWTSADEVLYVSVHAFPVDTLAGYGFGLVDTEVLGVKVGESFISGFSWNDDTRAFEKEAVVCGQFISEVPEWFGYSGYVSAVCWPTIVCDPVHGGEDWIILGLGCYFLKSPLVERTESDVVHAEVQFDLFVVSAW